MVQTVCYYLLNYIFFIAKTLLYSFYLYIIIAIIVEIYDQKTLYPILGNNQIIFKISIITFFIISFFFTCFSNPGIVEKEKWDEKIIKEKYNDFTRFKYCKKCHIFVPKFFKSQHCNVCGICVEKQSHHSFIFSKCIGKYNLFFYHLFLFLFLVYAVILFLNKIFFF